MEGALKARFVRCGMSACGFFFKKREDLTWPKKGYASAQTGEA